ncbi:LytR/AlgR family response regulator transcription factor [Sphingobacterium sp. SYP-B4668]|uniref:LytR/AlgR family response regulator transcription factor n=1 Tax=Sphingobacterium sp. SYP-B4668 TaxID=2996035 RepID=UPI0022DE6A40|nr:LytTR family DNA-binding domain-containing protein [Sphingobacterium sp. SYP-B4668]
MESKRSGYNFYLSESLLFKTVWLLFVPILMTLYRRLKNQTLNGVAKIFIFIVSPLVAHLFILPFVTKVVSVFFYDGRYDIFKFFSYTIANDFYKLVIVYTIFVLGYKYISNRIVNTSIAESKFLLDTIIVNNGKDNVTVSVQDIVKITSATPYISIHLENKKYLHSETLKSICEQLDANIFVRIHKSTVVNISKVISFKSRLNGDYDLQLANGISVRLSRTYATDFKKQFNTGHRVGI